MAGKILDSQDGVTEVFHKGHHRDKKFTISYHEDVQPLMDANKAERNNASENWKGDFHKVASIPMTIIIEWSKEVGGGMNILKPENKKKFVAKLNDPDFVNLRTKLGNI